MTDYVFQFPFGQIGNTIYATVSSTTSNVALGWVGIAAVAPPTTLVYNLGSIASFVLLGTPSTTVTTASGSYIPPSTAVPTNLATNGQTNIAVITASGATTILIANGAGRP